MRGAARIGALVAVTTTLTVLPASAATSPVTVTVDLPRHSAVAASTMLAADYYRTTYGHTTLTPKNGWSWSTYFQGAQALYRATGNQRYLNDGLAWGNSNAWGITTNVYETDPNSLKAAETYADLAAISPAASLTAADAAMAHDLVSMPDSAYDWADALFMGLPDWTRWAARTGDSAYLDKMDALFAYERDQGGTSSRCGGPVAQNGLFDAAQGLWFRDCTFIGQQDANGEPVYWARANGWVIAAMAQVLQSLPAGDVRGAPYVSMLQTMAARLVQLQGSDGLWRSSLLDPSLYPQPETSSTALITYALAYGIQSGVLDAPTYLPVVARAWQGLTTIALQSNGFLTGCQGAAAGPGAPYTAKTPRTAPTSTSAGTVNTDSPPFCVGAFLLAGAEVAQLTSSPSTGRPTTATGQQVGNEASHIDDGDVTTRWSAEAFPKAVTVDLGADYRLSNAMVVPYLDRAYRYRIDTSTDNVHWTLAVDRTTNTATGTRLDDFTTVTARYARLTVTGVYGVATDWASIQEFAVYDRFLPRVDLARARPTSATSSLSGHAATAATDASASTYWSAAKVPTGPTPQGLLTDLGVITPIDTVRLFSRAGCGPHHVTVLVSTTGGTYVPVASGYLANAEGPSQFVFPTVNARWVRLTTTSSYCATTVSVEELEVFRG
jgi:rhamnogalacturonyl hydrolase YesR